MTLQGRVKTGSPQQKSVKKMLLCPPVSEEEGITLREGEQHPRVTLGSKGWLRITLLSVAREQPGCSDAELSAHPLELEMPLLPRPGQVREQ